MINRAREFLPEIRPASFNKRGTAGIRSMLVDGHGKFIGDTMIIKDDYSLHVLNYNSPGATGALPLAALIADGLVGDGLISSGSSAYSVDEDDNFGNKKKSLWDIVTIADQMRGAS